MTDPSPQPHAAPAGVILGVALISAATLAVQVLQTRLFSVMLWHHLTYMVVTVTLLGFAAGGSLLAAWPSLGRAGGDPRRAVSTCCSLFGLTLIGAFAILNHSSLDTLDIEQDRSQYFYLFLHYAYLVVPFLFAGLAIAIALKEFPATVHRTYFWNLIGSGIGSFLFLLLIRALGGPGCLFLFASLGGWAGLAALRGTGRAGWPLAALAIGAAALWPAALAMPEAAARLVRVEPARSKAQTAFEGLYAAWADAMQQRDPEYERPDPALRRTLWTPTCRIDTLPIPKTAEDDQRDRAQPGTGPRSQVHVFQDGDAPTAIWSAAHARERGYDRHFYGLGYRLVDSPNVLIIGPGGGNDVETALHYRADAVTAVDINGDTLALVQSEPFKSYSGDVYGKQKVRAVHSEGRSFLRREGATYDLIQMSGTDTYAALSSGSYVFAESYLYTEEAFDDYFAHLSERGLLSIIRFRFEPPRETLKLVATAATALRRLGVQDPRAHFIVVNQTDRQALSLAEALEAQPHNPDLADLQARLEHLKQPLRYSLTLMRRTPFSAAEVDAIRAAIQPMNSGGDPPLVHHEVYYGAGFAGTETEYGHMLAAAATGEDAVASWLRDYDYFIEPATDDKPFFFHFNTFADLDLFESESSADYEALTGSEPIGLYILAALLVQTGIATVLLVLLPLLRIGFGGARRGRVLLFFSALGLAYLLVEITTIQRFVLYLGHPTYSLSAGLACFLVFSGIGSATAGCLGGSARLATIAALAVVALLFVHGYVLPGVLLETLAWSESARVGMTVAWIAPLAFAMGMPFPTGLRLLGRSNASLMPWAFGINGAASVLASIVSIVVAMQWGFTAVFVAAALLYLLAAVTVPKNAH